jgi:hypothetical protein
MRAGDAAAPFVSWPTRAKLLNHRRLSSRARCTLPMASCDLGPCTDGLDKTAPLKRSDATKEPLAKELPTPSQAYCGAARLVAASGPRLGASSMTNRLYSSLDERRDQVIPNFILKRRFPPIS